MLTAIRTWGLVWQSPVFPAPAPDLLNVLQARAFTCAGRDTYPLSLNWIQIFCFMGGCLAHGCVGRVPGGEGCLQRGSSFHLYVRCSGYIGMNSRPWASQAAAVLVRLHAIDSLAHLTLNQDAEYRSIHKTKFSCVCCGFNNG